MNATFKQGQVGGYIFGYLLGSLAAAIILIFKDWAFIIYVGIMIVGGVLLEILIDEKND